MTSNTRATAIMITSAGTHCYHWLRNKMKYVAETSNKWGGRRTQASIDSRNEIPAEVEAGDNDYEINDDYDDENRDENDGQLASSRAIQNDIISKFPQDHLVHCFGYGSGVFTQSLSREKGAANAGMLDLILVVDDTQKFHNENLQRFPHHYAPWLRFGGPNLATRMQRQGLPWLPDAHVLFHVVDADESSGLPNMKYGVVDKKDLVGDLVGWYSLYLAGRMHKPTLNVVSRDDDLVRAQTKNLRAATSMALLLSSSANDTATSAVSWPSLYRQIAALSYTGDFRMQVGGEDPLKLDKLIQAPGQLQRFHDMYRPIFKSYEMSGFLSTSYPSSGGGGSCGVEWNPNDPSVINQLVRQLPKSLREGTATGTATTKSTKHLRVNHDVLAKALSAIVAPAARNQSFKGVFTLGFRKSIRYASAKLSKGLFARKK